MSKGLHCQSATSRVFDDKGLFQKVSNQKAAFNYPQCETPFVRVCACARVSPAGFPPPWSVEELDACYVARDDNGQKLAYVYFEAPFPALPAC